MTGSAGSSAARAGSTETRRISVWHFVWLPIAVIANLAVGMYSRRRRAQDRVGPWTRNLLEKRSDNGRDDIDEQARRRTAGWRLAAIIAAATAVLIVANLLMSH
jgi:hypothetical protein